MFCLPLTLRDALQPAVGRLPHDDQRRAFPCNGTMAHLTEDGGGFFWSRPWQEQGDCYLSRDAIATRILEPETVHLSRTGRTPRRRAEKPAKLPRDSGDVCDLRINLQSGSGTDGFVYPGGFPPLDAQPQAIGETP